MNIWAKIIIMVYSVFEEALMEKIEIENSLGLVVYVNGKPNLALMPKEMMDVLCASLLSFMEKGIQNNE